MGQGPTPIFTLLGAIFAPPLLFFIGCGVAGASKPRHDPYRFMRSAKSLQRKVLVYKSALLPYSETFIREQALALSTWRAVLVGEFEVRDGLSLDGLDVALIGSGSPIVRKLARALRHFFSFVPKRTLRRLSEEHAELVHVHFATEVVKAWPLLQKMGLPILVTLHGQDITTSKDWWSSGRGGRAMKRYPEILLEIAAKPHVHFIAVSQAVKKQAIEFGLPVTSISVSYIGVDTEKFSPDVRPMADRRDVLFIGRLVEKKGCEYLLNAFHQVQDQFSDYRLVIIGSGPMESQLKDFAHKRAIRAHFTGALDSRGVRQHLSEARVLCLPSVRSASGDAEGFGLVILEAQACGVPVITSALGGAKEGIVHGLTGCAHPERDIDSMKKALSNLLANDQLCTQYGIEARRRAVEQFDIGVCTRSLEEIYGRCTGNTRREAFDPTDQYS